jgi:hypothetical protein
MRPAAPATTSRISFMIDLPRSHSYPVYNPRRPQGKASAKVAAPPFLLPNCAFSRELHHRVVIAIVYVRFDSGPHSMRARVARRAGGTLGVLRFMTGRRQFPQ